MDVNKLIHMANQIGGFYVSMPDRQQAVIDLANHLKKSWDPRMRRELLQYIREQHGEDLIDIVLEAARLL